MATAKTIVTELVTALGMLRPGMSLDEALSGSAPAELLNLDEHHWDRLCDWRAKGRYSTEYEAAFRNGRWFTKDENGLAGRTPARVEWKGSHRVPGDEVVPADLRVDRVWLVSCKYLSKNIHNVAPARLFTHLLLTIDSHDSSDWYLATAPKAFQRLFEEAVELCELANMPHDVGDLTSTDRQRMKGSMKRYGRRKLPEPANRAYEDLIVAVSRASADRWRAQLGSVARQERMLWRLLRLCSAPYFILGSTGDEFLRLRIETPWDWRQSFEFHELEVTPTGVGQPEVTWKAMVTERQSGEEIIVHGRVEIRWSHGRFSAPPEAKIYLETPHRQVPGYTPVDNPLGRSGEDRLFD